MEGRIDPLNKGMGTFGRPLTPTEIAARGWNLLREDLALPVAVLYEERLAHNLDWMRRFIEEYGVALCPHGKTTMAPKLFQRQIEAGAWGITLATVAQTHVAYAHGFHRVLMANQLVGRQNMNLISRIMDDEDFEFYCLVDSPENLNALGRFFGDRGQRLNVLIEVGVAGGRTGIRDRWQLNALLAAHDQHRNAIALCGVELFEGVASDEDEVRKFLVETIDTAQYLAEAGRFDRTPFILSGAGSTWFDVVADMFTKATFAQPAEIVLRPGCYLTQDVGAYHAAQNRMQRVNPVVQRLGSTLLPALQVWAYVQSVPEPGLAVMGLGKRDAAFDSGLPSPAQLFRPGSFRPVAVPAHWKSTHIMDQHIMVQVAPGDDVVVGDMVAFDICHPCLTFDKWRHIAVVDAEYKVVDMVSTHF